MLLWFYPEADTPGCTKEGCGFRDLNAEFGKKNTAGIYGWVFGAHQLGAALLAYLGGVMHDSFGNYTLAFVGSGVLAVMGAGLAMRIEREPQFESPVVAGAPA